MRPPEAERFGGRLSASPQSIEGPEHARAEAVPLFGRCPALEQRLPRLSLSSGASPIRRLSSLDRHLASGETWIKNDGLYGTVYGGNKPRKLEFILADALRKGARSIITTGGVGTNHGLATALYAGEAGVKVALLLTYEQPDDATTARLCRMQEAGADLHYTRSLPWTLLSLPWFALRYPRPYLLWPGASTPLGALGYVNAAFELADQVRAGQLPEPEAIILPLGSGGTAAGLLLGLGLAGLRSRLIAVAVTRAPTAWPPAVRRLARQTARLMASRGAPEALAVELPPFAVTRGWLGPGFGRPSHDAEKARRLLADVEGLTLDSTYSAKTMAALIALRRSGSVRGPALYWHTYDALSAAQPGAPADPRRLPRAFQRFCPLA